jgi:pilus assembly protein CpaF
MRGADAGVDDRELHRRLLGRLDLRRTDVSRMADGELRSLAAQCLREVLDEQGLADSAARTQLERQLLQEVVGRGVLEDLLEDEDISEIMINGPSDIFIEKRGVITRTTRRFAGHDALERVIERLLLPTGRRVDESSPMVDARLPDGSRINVVVSPLAVHGAAITIRKFGRRLFSLDQLAAQGAMSPDMATFLRGAVLGHCNIVVSGGTGSGKTTLLNALAALVPQGERIVTIEDSAELHLEHPNRVALQARPMNLEGQGLVTIRDLVRNALRMRPDRIVVGECRGGEALDMLQAMNTGHAGSLTTAHANSPRDLLSRLEVMVLMAGMDLPVQAIREQVASAITLVVQQTRDAEGTRRVSQITEVTGMEGGRIQVQDLFRHHAVRGFESCGNPPMFLEHRDMWGLGLSRELFLGGRT